MTTEVATLYRYRLLAGTHETGKRKEGTYKVYTRGQVFDTETDLREKFPSGFELKFQELPTDGTWEPPPLPENNEGMAAQQEPTLEDQTVDQLKEMADELQIGLSGMTLKAEIIAAIREATEG